MDLWYVVLEYSILVTASHHITTAVLSGKAVPQLRRSRAVHSRTNEANTGKISLTADTAPSPPRALDGR